MKKLISLLLAVSLLAMLVACSGKGETEKPADTMPLTDLLAEIQNGVDLPETSTTELTAENFTFFAFVEPPEGTVGLSSDAIVNAVPHSVVLMRAANEEDAKQLADDVEANMDPRKWICVEADKSAVAVHGCTVLMVMSSVDATDALIANFDALWK